MEILKGNAVVGQSGGPTSAINATLSGIIRGVFANENIYKIYGMKYGIEGMINDNLILLNEMFRNDEEFELLETTPAAILGSCRLRLPEIGEDDSVYEQVFETIRSHNIRYFFYIGGNDSMDTVNKMTEYAKKIGYDINIVGVPKTIDNDLAGTDHSPGYGSAAKFIATIMQEIVRDNAVYSMASVAVTEVMGRDAGWLTAAAALPRLYGGEAPDFVYFPEVEFDIDRFIGDIKDALLVKNNVTIAVSEGIKNREGEYICEMDKPADVDIFGNKLLSGAARKLCDIIKDRIGCKVRSIELNTPQRCAAHLSSLCDINESVAIGKSAVEYAVDGKTGVMMTFNRLSTQPYRIEIGCCDVRDVANATRTVPLNYIKDEKNDVTNDCLRYIFPLILGEPRILFQNGIPVHFNLNERIR